VGASSFIASANGLSEQAVKAIWRQWAALGAATTAEAGPCATADPEALVLASLSFDQFDDRLVQLAHDWVVLNADVLSVQRMRNLAASFPEHTREALGELARLAVTDAKDARWRVLAAEKRMSPSKPTRGRVHVSRAPVTGASLVVRLRLAFGVGVKADLLAFLLGRAPGSWESVRAIARATSYSAAAARRGADALAQARVIQRRNAGEFEYSIDHDMWRSLFAPAVQPPPWRDWSNRFAFAAALQTLADRSADPETSEHVMSMRVGELLAVDWSDLTESALADGVDRGTLAEQRDSLARIADRLAVAFANEV